MLAFLNEWITSLSMITPRLIKIEAYIFSRALKEVWGAVIIVASTLAVIQMMIMYNLTINQKWVLWAVYGIMTVISVLLLRASVYSKHRYVLYYGSYLKHSIWIMAMGIGALFIQLMVSGFFYYQYFVTILWIYKVFVCFFFFDRYATFEGAAQSIQQGTWFILYNAPLILVLSGGVAITEYGIGVMYQAVQAMHLEHSLRLHFFQTGIILTSEIVVSFWVLILSIVYVKRVYEKSDRYSVD
ncbi:MAG: hypothetical protein WBQ73_01655 [Candidatus Babeliales bacterium]